MTRITTFVLAGAVLAAAPALAQSPSGNVGQPERTAPQGGNADQNNKPAGNTGNTSGGPAR